jgi:hypothetical protein
MCKTLQTVGGTTHDIDKAMLAMDADVGQTHNPIQSKRCGGESGRFLLKRKARHITLSMAESFAYFTSKTSFIDEAADVLERFGGVSLCDLFFSFAYFAA